VQAEDSDANETDAIGASHILVPSLPFSIETVAMPVRERVTAAIFKKPSVAAKPQ